MTAPTSPRPSRVLLSNGMTAHAEADVLRAWLLRITSVSHVVQFAGGGELRCAYNAAGELSGKALAFTLSPSGQVLFRPCR